MMTTFTPFIHKESLFFAVIMMSIVFGLAIPKTEDTEPKKRILKDNRLSEEQHYRNEDEEHNQDYDHEAFLGGHEEAQEFDQLTPEESKSRLSKIVDRIDTDGDGFVTNEELRHWIRRSQKKYILDDVERQWKSHSNGEDSGGTLSWDEYKKRTFGFLNDFNNDNKNEVNDDSNTYREMLKRDERRWRLADRNGDNALTKEEFADFLHPEEAEHMRDVVVDETLEDIDKNGDGKVSVQEYISDMYAPDATGDQVPDWVQREKEQFHNHRDQNKDGFMDRHEIREWIIPPDYDHSDAESRHLIEESDANKDGKLTKEEILESYDVFVGSQATDFGEALMRHEEF